MNKKVISIVGPTATGKTEFALTLAQKIIEQNKVSGILIISADSRQVYQGLEVLSGADIPNNFNKINNPVDQFLYDYFQHHQLPLQIHGVSIINPQEEWSVAHFVKFAKKLIDQAFSNNQLPIIVGGTGFYHQQLLKQEPSLSIKPNQQIRKKASQKTIDELHKWLKNLNPKKLAQMNNSDANNPRRLIRAIEIEQSKKNKNNKKQSRTYSTFQIGIKNNPELLEKKIIQRVENRLNGGAIEEVKSLLNINLPETSSIKTATGFKPISQYLDNQLSLEEAKRNWLTQELQYAKRQITWFKQHSPDIWIDCLNDNLQIEIQKIISEFVDNS